MASYIDLRNLFSDDTMKNRTDIAVVVAASDLLAGLSPTPDEQKWAAAVFSNPRGEGGKAFMAVIAANKDATIAQIQGSTDAALQTNVDSVVPDLVVAHAALGV